MDEPSRDPYVIWRVRLLDGPALEDASGNLVRRFRSQRVGALLAYLALRLGKAVPREELFEALWPEEDTVAVSNRFRFTLSSLRHQLEQPGMTFGSVLDVSEPGRVRLRSEAVWCDVESLERALRDGRPDEAADLARGTLLPGYYDEWVVTERERLEALSESLGQGHGPPIPPPRQTTPTVAPITPHVRLPLYLTRFFGRESERERLAEQISANRLVTITGPGGIGKTRLAVETARELALPSVFVALADVPDAGGVAEALLRALMITPPGSADAVDHLSAVLQQREALLIILDNAEHLVATVASLSMSLLGSAPHLKVLITSRQRMDLPGESVLPLEPLAPPTHAAALERLLEFPSVSLFVDRARNARPDFTVSPAHLDSLVEICRRLEGMPLALELAAAHVTSLSPSRIAQTLATNITDLTSHQRGVSARHRSLRAAIQGSYDLLPKDARHFFAMLSVFRGSWTAEAARAVTCSRETDSLLDELVRRSLVVATEDEPSGQMRFSFLESLRQFAAEELARAHSSPAVSGKSPDALRFRATVETGRRHASYYLGLVEAGASEIEAQGTSSILAELETVNENLRAALRWSFEACEFEMAHRFTRSLSDFWRIRGLLSDGRVWNEELLKSWPGAPPGALAEIRLGCGVFAVHQNDLTAAKEHIEQSMALYTEQGDKRGILNSTLALGNAQRLGGEHLAALDRYQECLLLCESPGSDNDLAKCHHGLGVSAIYLGHYADARDHLDIALTLRKRMSHRLDVARTQNLLAFATEELGELDEAEQLFHECQEVFVEYGERWYQGSTMFGLSIIASGRDQMEAARVQLESGLAIMRDIGSQESMASILELLSWVFVKLGLVEEARSSVLEALQIALRTRNSQTIAMALWAATAVLEALAQYETSASVLSASTAAFSRLSITLFRIGQPDIKRRRAHLLEVLGGPVFDRAAKAGQSLSAEAAAQLAVRALTSTGPRSHGGNRAPSVSEGFSRRGAE